ncbi:MAG: fatty acid desaturase [bacterium]|nr:MAG: fatty acid desaturase [bacterium]
MKSKITSLFKGLLIAIIIISVWATSLVFLLTRNLHELHLLLIPLVIIWQTFLYTGLFITAHDAMHGAVFPANRKINNAIGTFIVFIYAFFSYKNLVNKHWDHHKYPASSKDPDFHDDIHKNFLQWYSCFIKNYVNWKQIIGFAIIFNVLLHLFRIPIPNLLLFWVTPSILSTFQLFYFGTFLPHRETSESYKDKHRARSVRLPAWLSFLTCFHFGGFHWEHHTYPNLAWWELPSTRVH